MDAMSIIGADCEAHMRIFIRLYLIFLALMILLFCIAIVNDRVTFDGWYMMVLFIDNTAVQGFRSDHGIYQFSMGASIPLFTVEVLFVVGMIAGIGSLSYRLLRSMKSSN